MCLMTNRVEAARLLDREVLRLREENRALRGTSSCTIVQAALPDSMEAVASVSKPAVVVRKRTPYCLSGIVGDNTMAIEQTVVVNSANMVQDSNSTFVAAHPFAVEPVPLSAFPNPGTFPLPLER